MIINFHSVGSLRVYTLFITDMVLSIERMSTFVLSCFSFHSWAENQFSILIMFCHFRLRDYIFVYFSLGGVFSRDEQQFRVRVSEGQARSSLRTSIFDAERHPGLPYSIFVHYSNTLNECA